MSEDKQGWLHPKTDEDAEIRFLVENTDVSPMQAEELVAKHGTNRAKLLEIARTLKAEG